MQVIAADVPSARRDRLRVARSAATAALLLLAGAMLAWLCLGTQLVHQFIPTGRPSTFEVAMGILAWGFTILVPAAFVIIGMARMAGVVDAIASLRPTAVTPRLAGALGQDHLAATDLLLPGGRRIHELVLGPFGIVVLGEVPPPSISRHVGTRWEVRDGRGHWIPVEAPVDRASRDAERVRGWLMTHDRDFLVRVYAAVVTDDARATRSPSCAVVAPKDLAAWLQALPVQRGLTAERRERVVELIRSVARSGR
ncbi:MAG TPA: hypothetical protein VFY23_15095 [Candidatus Limnocylindrales bacterium]|nr:hypothetical protein [Candidatus Limnocylindrales bacterium]